MKKISISIVYSLISISVLFAQNKPKKTQKYVRDSKIMYEYYMQNGKPNGAYTYYYDNEKQVEGYLKEDYPDGEWKYYDERGKIRIKGNYKQGEKVGPWYYYIKDTLKSKLLFDPDGKIDTLYGYWPDGTISHIKIVDNIEDKSSSIRYSNKGLIIEKSTEISGKLHGNLERFNEKGEKTLELIFEYGKPMNLKKNERNALFQDHYSGFLVNGNGVLTTDFINPENNEFYRGLEISYVNGEINGSYKKYYPTGKPFCEGQFKDGFLYGNFTFYDESGKKETVYYNLTDALKVDYERGVVNGYSDNDFKVQTMPTFFGGDHNIFRYYIQQTLKYPLIAAENGVQGRVLVKFSVNSVGEVVDPEVVSSVDPALDAEALRVVGISPLWQPGFLNDLPVKVQFTFPISFKLQ